MDRNQIFQRSLDYFLAPIAQAIDDPEVTEILINGPNQVFVERRGALIPAGVSFPDEFWLESLARNVAEYVGRHLDREHQSLSGRLPKGYRVHVIVPPTSRSGVCISIRKFSHQRLTLAELVKADSITAEAAQMLELAVELKCNIAVSGGTGVGKTTFLNALTSAIPAEERILVLEETSELRLDQPHTVYFETQQPDSRGRGGVSLRDLFVDSLRMRPDRIIVGEVRRGEALDMIQSMLSGHSGALTTVHANSPMDAITRLETLCLMSDTSLPHHAARLQVASAVHLVVQLERLNGRRRIKAVSECRGLTRSGQIRLRSLLHTAYVDDCWRLTSTGKSAHFLAEPYARHAAQQRPLVAAMLEKASLARSQSSTVDAKKSSARVAAACTNGN